MDKPMTAQDVLNTIAALSCNQIHINTLSEHMGIPAQRLSSFLRILELFDRVEITEDKLISLKQ